MKCPNDSATLVMSERNGIEIDYCPECRGVWLDRGELDKIIDRASAGASTAAPAAPAYQPPPQQGHQPQYDSRGGHDHRGGYGQQPYKKRKENWLSELFD